MSFPKRYKKSHGFKPVILVEENLFFAWRPEICDAQLSNDVLKGSYWLSKSTDFEILSPLQKIRGVAKKRHGHNFDFLGPP